MKKAIVIGCPGSGKSVFSRALAEATGLPLYHLDMMYWNADSTKAEREIFLRRLAEAMAGDEWIIDGNYSSTMEMRLAAADTVFFLDYPTEVCLRGIEDRRGKARSDMPWVETAEDPEFTEFIRTYREEQKPRVLALIAAHPEKDAVVFSSREESEDYLEKAKQK